MIKHNTSATIVFQTKEFKNFVMINGNRGINNKKVERIIEDIKEGNDMLDFYPIHVSVAGGKMQILDGQHRFMVARKLNRPVHYIIISEKKTMRDIANVNSNVEKWTPANFISCYTAQDNKDYQALQNFIDKYGINIGTSIRLLSFGMPGVDGSSNNSVTNSFQKGNFKVKTLGAATDLAEDCKKFESFRFWRDRAFVIAIYRIRKAGLVSIDEVAAAFMKYPDMLVKQHSHKQYIFNLEQVVNCKKQKRTVII